MHGVLSRQKAMRCYRQLPGVIVDTLAAPAPDPTDELAAARARVAQLEQEWAALISTIGYLTGDVADALQAAVNTLRSHKPAA